MKISEITIANRFRKDLGDVRGLADSIQRVGLLHPVVVNIGGELIAGERRIEAYKLMGRDDIPVTQIDLDNIITGEMDENFIRKDFAPTEKVAIWEAMESYQGHRQPLSESDRSGTRQQRAAQATGASTDTLSKARQVVIAARNDPEEYEAIAEKMDETGNVNRAYTAMKQKQRSPVAPLPSDKYRIIYADPPWSYGNVMPEYYKDHSEQYPLMTIKELCQLPVRDIVEDNAVLFMWATSPILYESFEVITAWGFKYKASFVWDKIKHNMGHYNSVRHEFLLICTRGSCTPDIKRLFDSVVSIERTKHSKKPAYFRDIIDILYVEGKKIELFARSKSKGWEVYGNEC